MATNGCKIVHLQPFAATYFIMQPFAEISRHLLLMATSGCNWLQIGYNHSNVLAATCSHLKPFAANIVWLKLVASGCKWTIFQPLAATYLWLHLAANGCIWRHIAALCFQKINVAANG